MVEKRWLAVFIVICGLGLDQWFSKWSISTPRGQLDHPRGR